MLTWMMDQCVLNTHEPSGLSLWIVGDPRSRIVLRGLVLAIGIFIDLINMYH